MTPALEAIEARFAPGTALRQRLEQRARQLGADQHASPAELLDAIHAHYTNTPLGVTTMSAIVLDAEALAEQVGAASDNLSQAEQARIASAAHRILNLVEPHPRADAALSYHNH